MKTSTDLHWNQRALSVQNDAEVNIMDVFQRNLEYDFILKHIDPSMRVLETGCGNGFSTQIFRQHVREIDAFDFSEEMIARAKATYGETNNRFIVDNVLSPQHLGSDYDVVICVRVLINLKDLEAQRTALRNLRELVRPGGLLLLVEGFTEGFEGLTELREQVGLPPVQPAAINFYSSQQEVLDLLRPSFTIEDELQLGMYDFLTRVVYPLVVGPENAVHNTVFSEKAEVVTRVKNPDSFAPLSRVHGWAARRAGARD